MEVSQAEVVLCEFYFSDLRQNKLRPVVVFKNNLPFNDFVGMPVSSKVDRLNEDEILIAQSDFLVGQPPQAFEGDGEENLCDLETGRCEKIRLAI